MRKLENGYFIKGGTKVVRRLPDSQLQNAGAISGYAYSKFEKTFLKDAVISFSSNSGTTTDNNGHFRYELKPGQYDVSCKYLGHTTGLVKELKVKAGEQIVIVFELGTSVSH